MPKFSVITPCYNSAKLLNRVYNSLLNQTYKDFEWILINDASIDSTQEIIDNYIQENKIVIKSLSNKSNFGVFENYNIAHKLAEGKYIYYADHDDEIPDNALGILKKYLDTYDAPDIGSIAGMCVTPEGQKIGKDLPQNPLISDYFKVFYEMNLDAERLFCYKRKVALEFPFNTRKYGMQMGLAHHGPPALKYKTIFINEAIKIYYPNVSGSMTKQGRKKYSFGIYNAYVFWVNIAQYKINGRYLLKLRWHFAQVLYGLIANLELSRIVGDIESLIDKAKTISFVPIAYIVLFCLKLSKKINGFKPPPKIE